MPWIQVDPEDVVEKSLLDALKDKDSLSDDDAKAFKHVLAFYMIPSEYNVRFGENEWEKIMNEED